MPGNARLIFPVGYFDIFSGPDVVQFDFAFESKLPKINVHVHGLGVAIEKRDRLGAIRQRTHPYFRGAFRAYAISLDTGLVLINGNDLAVGKEADCFGRHGAQIVSREQGRRQDGPEAHVRAVFLRIHASVADFQHVRIIPMARAGILRDSRLTEADFRHARIPVADVAGGAP